MEDCNDKLDRYNDGKICRMLSVNETVETPVTLIGLSVVWRCQSHQLFLKNAFLNFCDVM
jgi:hypothetical protein